MTNAELITKAFENTADARKELSALAVLGRTKPVPTEAFIAVRHLLSGAVCAVQELENRAKGFAEPKHG